MQEETHIAWSSTVHNSQNAETTQLFIGRWRDEPRVVHTTKYYPAIKRDEILTPATTRNELEKCHAKWNKPWKDNCGLIHWCEVPRTGQFTHRERRTEVVRDWRREMRLCLLGTEFPVWEVETPRDGEQQWQKRVRAGKPGVGTLFCEVPGGKYFGFAVQLFCGIPAVVAKAATESSWVGGRGNVPGNFAIKPGACLHLANPNPNPVGCGMLLTEAQL